MQNICEHCGMYRADKLIAPDGRSMACPACGFVVPLRRLPLFVVTGASGAGKSTAMRELYKTESAYLVMEADVLWEDRYNDPDGQYRDYYERWLRMCKNIAQGGRPVVLAGCAAPYPIEPCMDSSVRYLALVAEDGALEARLQARPLWRNSGSREAIAAAQAYNRWLKENAADAEPPMTLLDNTALSPAETAALIDRWIRKGIAAATGIVAAAGIAAVETSKGLQ